MNIMNCCKRAIPTSQLNEPDVHEINNLD